MNPTVLLIILQVLARAHDDIVSRMMDSEEFYDISRMYPDDYVLALINEYTDKLPDDLREHVHKGGVPEWFVDTNTGQFYMGLSHRHV